jgi:hypothetical protein
MRKRVLLCVAGAVALLAVIATVVMPIFSSFSGEMGVVEEFFAAFFEADCDRLRGMMTPKLADSFDDPLIAVSAEGSQKFLGEYQGVDMQQFRIVKKLVGPAAPTRILCVLRFKNGTAKAAVEMVGDKVATYVVRSERIPSDWVPIPVDTTYWREKGKEFFGAFFGGRVEEAFRMMRPSLQKKVPLERLRKDAAVAFEVGGKLLSSEFVSEKKHPSGKGIAFRYRLKYENGTKEVELQYEFHGLKGYITGVAPVEKDGSVRTK